MSNRNYNVFFNTHTVSGIVISVTLYIIFFAGAFALFKDEIQLWEEGALISHTQRHEIDFDYILSKLGKDYDLTARDLQINFGEKADKISIFISKSKDSTVLLKDEKSHFFYLDIHSVETKTYQEQYNLGEFLYRLHFFHQLPTIGIYLAGFVSLFFLFAIVTGVIVHWKKIIPNFYSFNPKIALKRVWTDAHTALGIIGLPFQFIFAVTGAYFCLSVLVLIPANFLYDNDQEKLLEDLRPTRKTFHWQEKSSQEIPSYNNYVKQTKEKWGNDFHVTRGFIKNYAGNNMKYIINGELATSKRFIGVGSVTYNAFSGEIEKVKNPNELSYLEDAQFFFGRLHFANFGGVPIKTIYFILALITCFVIITGVLIWIEARNKKSKTLRQRLYTAKVGHIYLAICLSMLPVTALAFIFARFTHGFFTQKTTPIYLFYFGIWLVAILYFRFQRNNYFTNKTSLLLGVIFGFLVPIVNGLTSGNWLHKTLANQQYEIATIDILWLLIASTALLIYFKISSEIQEQSAFSKNPIEYNNLKALKAEEANRMALTQTPTTVILEQETQIPMRTKIVILWLFLGIGWIVHHIYGLFNIYYNETLVMEGATGQAPFAHHIYRILFEGLCLLFALLTIEVSKKWFIWLSLIWASIAGLYNIVHLFEAIVNESQNISEIFMLLLVAIASVFLLMNLNKWRKVL